MIEIIIYILKVVIGTFLASYILVMAGFYIYNMILIFITETYNYEQGTTNSKTLSQVGPIIWYSLMIYIILTKKIIVNKMNF